MGGDDRGRFCPTFQQAFLLVGGMIKVPPVGQWKGIDFFLRVMDGRIIDLQAILLDEKPGIPIQPQIR